MADNNVDYTLIPKTIYIRIDSLASVKSVKFFNKIDHEMTMTLI